MVRGQTSTSPNPNKRLGTADANTLGKDQIILQHSNSAQKPIRRVFAQKSPPMKGPKRGLDQSVNIDLGNKTGTVLKWTAYPLNTRSPLLQDRARKSLAL